MQILPIGINDTNSGFGFDFNSLSSSDDFSFNSILSQAAKYQYDAEKILEAGQSLFKKNIDENDPTIEEENNSKIYFDRTDLLALKNKLAKSGINADRLDRINSLIDSGDTINLIQIQNAMKMLSGIKADGKPAFALDSDDKVNLELFLRKIGFSQDKAGELITGLESGGDTAIWDSVLKQISSLQPQNFLSINASEISALLNAFRLNDKQKNAIQNIFPADSINLLPESLKLGLTILSQEMSLRRSSDGKLAETLKDIIPDLIKEAKERQKLAEASDKRNSKENTQQEILIADRALDKTGIHEKSAMHGTRDKHNDNNNAANAELNKNNSRELNELFVKEYNDKQSLNKLLDEQQQNKNHGNFDKQNQKQNESTKDLLTAKTADNIFPKNSENAAKDKPNPIDALLAKLTFHTENKLSGNTQQAQSTNSNNNEARTAFTNNLFYQIESGVLKTLNNGTHQITLQLDPAELGTLSVILSVKNKEVSAIIKPENPEMIQAIEDQVHKLRLSLEQQGLKVEKIEVRKELNDSTQSWEQNLAQHNESKDLREHNEQQSLFRRIKLFGFSGQQNSNQNELMDSAILAIKYADSKINIFA